MDKEVLLHIIDGPGHAWAWMFIALVGGIVLVILARTFNGAERGFAEGQASARREGIDEMRATLARLTFDQQKIIKKVERIEVKDLHDGT